MERMEYSAESNNEKCFISYDELDQRDRMIFLHSGLNRFVNAAKKILKSRISTTPTHDISKPIFSTEDLATVNNLIKEILDLIRRRNMACLGESVSYLNRLFRRPEEISLFPIYFHFAKRNEIHCRINKKKYKNVLERNYKLHGSATSKSIFKGIPTTSRIRFGSSEMNETETRAVAVLYMVDLIWPFIKKNRADSRVHDFSFIFSLAGALYSLLDASSILMGQAEGGKRFDKKEKWIPSDNIIQKIVQQHPNLDTQILVRKVVKKIELTNSAGDEIAAPSSRTIADKIRKIRRKFT